MFIDSHAHLFYEDYREDLQDVLQRARDAGVEIIVIPGTNLETSREAVELAEKHQGLYACVGFHPHEASKASDTDLVEIERLSANQKVVAIGEVGLDYHYDYSPPERQRIVFQWHIELAIRRNLPVVIHTRESIAEAISIVRENSAKAPGWCRGHSGGVHHRGVFHCFTGSAVEANELFGLGFYISYGGIVTFKKSPAVDTLRAVGMERVLLETDSPYLSPVPMRGKRNEPGYLIHSAKKISELLDIPVPRLAEETSHNTRQLFRIG